MGELDATGYHKKTTQEYLDEFKAALTEQFGAGFVTDENNPIVRVMSIVAASLGDNDEGMEDIYQSQYPSSATGVSLDRVGDMTGVSRQGASKTTAIGYGWASGVTIIPEATQASVQQTNDLFTLDSETIIIQVAGNSLIAASSIAEAAGTATCTTGVNHNLTPGDYVIFPNASVAIYQHVFEVLTEDGTTGFTFSVAPGSGADATPGDMYYCTAMPFTAVEEGEISALSESLTQIETPVSGWLGVENVLDGILGGDAETDAEYRARRDASLSTLAGATFEAIKAAILNVQGVTGVNVFENATGNPDPSVTIDRTSIGGGAADPLPPYSVTVFALGGSDGDVAQAVFDSIAAGPTSFGNVRVAIIDSDGNSHDMEFARLDDIEIRIDMVLTEDEGFDLDFAATRAAIRASVDSYIESLGPGQDVLISPAVIAAVGETTGFYINSIEGGLLSAGVPTFTDKVAISATEVAAISDSTAQINIVINAASP